ncbi:MAG: hypothetical protein IJY39_06030 [Clostridia bacterium]|nr:hypothetical protein [Clostridia bacterium]
MKRTILCSGDSVTQGNSTESSYPGRLQAILTERGYDAEVINCGHGGECLSAIVARLGGVACYLAEDLVIPADNTPVSLGQRSFIGGHVSGTKLKLCYPDKVGEDLCVYFTQNVRDTNPLTIGGKEYILTADNDSHTDFIQKKDPDGVETVIPKGTLVFTAHKRCADVNIIFAGLNDGGGLTLQRWLDTMEACGKLNGGKYIIIGGMLANNHPLWNCWCDVKGDTPEEKYAYYRRAALERFGIHFLDLYEEFAARGLDLILSGGYFADKTAEELDVMRQKLKNHIIPVEITYNHLTDKEVHLSIEGYHGIAMLLAERLQLLGYLD